MKALTLTQPWATLVALGVKKIETRSWWTKHRGLLAIHAAKGFPKTAQHLCQEKPFRQFVPDFNALPRSVIVCMVRVVDCVRMTPELIARLSYNERAFGLYSFSRWAWMLELVQRFDTPIPAKGMLGLWNWERPA